ncbi:MAG: quinone oxidoreductase [Frankiales bacterium]|nr:quinone oxidoreductase [Frankiales bacterium]
MTAQSRPEARLDDRGAGRGSSGVGDAATMRALVLHVFGDDLVLQQVPRPDPAPGEVLVKVGASGVNPLDVKIRAGSAGHARVALPAVLGMDLAGTVVLLGDGVSQFAVGDEVYGMAGGIGSVPGSLAEYAAVDADLLARKPPSLSMVQAAALPLSVITAWEGLVDRAAVHAGQRMLVHGGAGGVGHVAVQLALARGAQVWATGSGAALDVIRGYGATAVDHTTTTVEQYVASETDGAGFDVVFDTVGGAVLDSSFTAVRVHTGHVLSILGWGNHSLAPLSFRAATYSGVFTLLPLLTGQGRAHHGQILTEAAALVEAGTLTPMVHPELFGWDGVVDAHQVVEKGAARGKVVVDLTGPAASTAAADGGPGQPDAGPARASRR